MANVRNNDPKQPPEPARNTPENAVAKDAEICCYIGPSITGVIQTNTIYAGNVKEAQKGSELKLAVKSCPGIMKLIVPGNQLADARQRVKTKGDPLYKAYRELAKK